LLDCRLTENVCSGHNVAKISDVNDKCRRQWKLQGITGGQREEYNTGFGEETIRIEPKAVVRMCSENQNKS
jgi:hypothetical protein